MPQKSVPKEALEREVTALTAAYVLRDDVIDYIADKVVEIQKSEHDDKSMLRYFESQLKDTNKAIANIMRAIEAGIITETTRSRLEELEDTKRDLETEIIKEKVARPTIEREQVIFFLKSFAAAMSTTRNTSVKSSTPLFTRSFYMTTRSR